jgi:hypothetical protein
MSDKGTSDPHLTTPPEATMSTETVDINTLINDTLADIGAAEGASIGEIANAIELLILPAHEKQVREQVAEAIEKRGANFLPRHPVYPYVRRFAAIARGEDGFGFKA